MAESYHDEPSMTLDASSNENQGVEIGINEDDKRKGVTSLTVMIGSWDSEAEINTEVVGLLDGADASVSGASLRSLPSTVAEEGEEVPGAGDGDGADNEGEEVGIRGSTIVPASEQAPQESPLAESALAKPGERKRMVSFNAPLGDDEDDDEDEARDQFPEHFIQEDDSEEEDIIDFLADPIEQMTYGRRIALYFMDRYKWYNPRLGMDEGLDDDDDSDNQSRGSSDGLGHRAMMKRSRSRRKKKKIVETTEKEIPSLEKAWAFFEHITLPRYVFNEKAHEAAEQSCIARTFNHLLCRNTRSKETFPMANMGERNLQTRLYDAKITPVGQMGNFGLGVGLYFSTLRALMILTFICGITSIPNYIFYSSETYSADQPDVMFLLKGSAICTNTRWVPCPDCGENVVTALNTISAVGRDDLDLQRVGFTVANVTNENEDGSTTVSTRFLFFALRNLCNGARVENGIVSFGTMLLFIFGMVVLNVYLANVEISLVEEVQRTSNYAIMISNPPGDARDPEEWKQFFEEAFEGAHVTTITIAVDNDLLVKTLVERRECMKQLKSQLEPGTKLDTLTLARVSAESERNRKGFDKFIVKFMPGIPELYGRVASLNIKCQGLAQLDHDAKKVYVVFEEEETQRLAMKELTVGHIQTKRQNVKAVKDPKYLFRGKHVLRVKQPDEPSSIRWQDMNAPFRLRFKQQFTTFLLTGGSIAGIAVVITTLSNIEPLYGTAAIATANVCFPEVAKWVVSRYESHRTAEDKQVSLYFKISASRIVNTTIILTIITPFTRTLNNDDGLIYLVYSQFLAEIVSANFLQITDGWENFRRHFIAPRMPSQDGMNLQMKGYPMELAERYTNITKLLCLCLWYYSIFPGCFFLCAASLYINIYVDKFALMRIWKRAPKLGTKLSQVGRKFVFTWLMVVMVVVSGFFFAGFPFDQLCVSEGTEVDPYFVGTWEIQTIESTLNENQAWWLGYWRSEEEDLTVTVTVEEGDPYYHVCPQSFLRGFWEEEESFFSEDQQTLVWVYGYSSCIVVAGVIFWYFVKYLASFRGLFRGRYKEPKRRDRHISFSDVPLISTFIPQVKSTYFSYPLLVCDIDQIQDETLFSWNDPDSTYEEYDLTRDAKKLIHGLDLGNKVVFSQIRHWPPIREEDALMGDESEFLEHDVLGETFATVVAPALKSLKMTSTATKVTAKTTALAAKTSALAAKSASKVAAKTTKAAATTSALAAKTATKATAKATATATKATAKATATATKATAKATMKGVSATGNLTTKAVSATGKATLKGVSATGNLTTKAVSATGKATMKGVSATGNLTTKAAKASGKAALKSTSALAKGTTSAVSGTAKATMNATKQSAKMTSSLAKHSAKATSSLAKHSAKATSSLAKNTAKSTHHLARSTAKSTRRVAGGVAGKSLKAAKSVARMSVEPGMMSSRNFSRSMRSMGSVSGGSISDDDMEDEYTEHVEPMEVEESGDDDSSSDEGELLPGEAY